MLLDEVEKAHPETFDILLQVLDDGRLTDGQGRTVDFRNVILVLTSNLGSQFLIDPVMSQEDKKEAVLGAVRAAFKPEFLNRLDEVVVFDPLSTEDLGHIVELQVRELATRLADRRITLEVTGPRGSGWRSPATTRPTVPVRCVVSCRRRSATASQRPCSPARSAMATPSWSTATTPSTRSSSGRPR